MGFMERTTISLYRPHRTNIRHCHKASPRLGVRARSGIASQRKSRHLAQEREICMRHGAPSVGILTIATNRYVRYWLDLAKTADTNLESEQNFVLHVFTDRPQDIIHRRQHLNSIETHVIPIEPLEWPLATLQKFEIFWNHRALLNQEFLMHLDADMLIAPGASIPTSGHLSGGIALVRHPGFRRPPRDKLGAFYLDYPAFIGRDTYRNLTEGGLGTWERDSRSNAYVARAKRSTYVCGGTWLGEREKVLAMCEELRNRTRVDSEKGIVARFHDESHLNWYAATRECTILDSDYCYVQGSPNLRDIKPQVIAVDKQHDRTR